ncbi:MAG: LysR family transcriptional regulator [Oscillibacter sp.]|nr:LysR family transcriptional regulator [Oscillibacter sp.]
MKLSTLQLFVQVMEQGSFSKAAIAAFTTQSNISKQICSLEEEIGVRLFERSNQGIQPTPAGVCLATGLKDQLPRLGRLLDQTRKAAAADGLSLKISISDSMSINHIAPLLTDFRESYPSAELKLIAMPQESILRNLANGTVDVALIYSVWPTDAASVTRKAITRTNPCIYYSSREWPGTVNVDTFRNAAFVRLEASSVDATLDLPYLPRQIIFVDSLRSLQFYVAAGMACAVLGKSQLMMDSADISTCELLCARNKVGTDAVWMSANKNPSIYLFKKNVEKFVMEGSNRRR